ncbi:hypothetical protein ACFFMR_18945 [Micromonospora andamanensis]|uniref:Uncharacterized protein n=1 Tax=Micromonospora andamanensis TaxID=1287068 RepID=A0ABQ4HYP5_9ACTN|nr:hypothetical protein [Micromonospora andamanensis]GIJ10745.1 hypothetical protein Van01_39590 [Micromonospora andamanensis]
MITIQGREWGTPAELAAALGSDVTEGMIRRWRDRKGLTTVAGYSPLDETARIERDARLSGRGRPRRVDVGAALVA